MNYDNSISASMWIMVIVQTIGSVDLTGGAGRKLPAPRVYVAIVVLWSTFHLLADAGMAKAAAVAGWITVLTGVTLGPFGRTMVGFLTTVASQFATPPTQAAAPTQSTQNAPIYT